MNRDIVKQLIHTEEWPLLLRHTYDWSDEETTPFREIIKKMPGKHYKNQFHPVTFYLLTLMVDVAEDILDKCTVANDVNLDDPKYSVIFNYEFMGKHLYLPLKS